MGFKFTKRVFCIQTGLFVDEKHSLVRGEGGLFRTGRWYLLGIQTLAAVSMFVWTIVTTFILLKVQYNWFMVAARDLHARYIWQIQ